MSGIRIQDVTRTLRSPSFTELLLLLRQDFDAGFVVRYLEDPYSKDWAYLTSAGLLWYGRHDLITRGWHPNCGYSPEEEEAARGLDVDAATASRLLTTREGRVQLAQISDPETPFLYEVA